MSRPHRRARHHRPVAAVALLSGWIVLSGCGSDTYQKRLDATRDYFAYLQAVNASLESSTWGEPVGMSLRVPKGFQEIPGPAVTASGDGDETAESAGDVAAADDPRQPSYMPVPLPGLEGAWSAEFMVADSEQPQVGYLYALTNYSMWAERAHDIAVDPLSFHEDVAHRIGVAVGETGLAMDDPRWEDQRFPVASDGYVPRKVISSIRLETAIDGVATEISVFLYEAKDIRAALVFVIPKDLDAPQPLELAITHCLETWEVSDATPTQGGKRKTGPKF